MCYVLHISKKSAISDMVKTCWVLRKYRTQICWHRVIGILFAVHPIHISYFVRKTGTALEALLIMCTSSYVSYHEHFMTAYERTKRVLGLTSTVRNFVSLSMHLSDSVKNNTGKLHTVFHKCKDICSFQSTVSWYLLWRTILVNLCCSTITDQTISLTKLIFCYFFQKTEHIIILNVNRKSITIKMVFVTILP